MKTRILRPVLPFLALPLLTASALAQTTGVAHPDMNDETPVSRSLADHYVKPSHNGSVTTAPAVRVRTQTTVTAPESYPATATSYPSTGPAPETTVVSQTSTQTSSEPVLLARHPLPTASAPISCAPVETASAQPLRRDLGGDEGIVLTVPEHPHELRAGTILRVRLDQTISTEETHAGARFSAQLLAPAGHSGEVLLPAGSTVLGRVTKVHGGKRISGSAAIRLQPETVNLPDGTSYHLAATVAGLEGYTDSKVTEEGTILAKNHAGIDAAALGLTTGAGAVTGAIVGAGVGAAVGAGIGAGVGTYMWLNRDHQETLPAGIGLLLSLDEPLLVNPR